MESGTSTDGTIVESADLVFCDSPFGILSADVDTKQHKWDYMSPRAPIDFAQFTKVALRGGGTAYTFGIWQVCSLVCTL
jgi:hypothetical protein